MDVPFRILSVTTHQLLLRVFGPRGLTGKYNSNNIRTILLFSEFAYINYVITPEALREPHDERLDRDIRRHIIALFKGYGWAVNNPHAVYDEVSAHCARLALRNSD